MRSSRVLAACRSTLLFVLAAIVPASAGAGQDTDSPPACGSRSLPGLDAQQARLERATSWLARRGSERRGGDALRLAAAEDVARVVAAVTGQQDGTARPRTGDGPDVAVGRPSFRALPCDPGIPGRDRVAWSMTLAGYSAREIADVLGGHLTRTDLDHARALLMAGARREAVSAFLDGRWKTLEQRLEAAPLARAFASRGGRASAMAPADRWHAHVAAFAGSEGLDPDLVRAVIAAESGGNPSARSASGAIGLMQLMPATAAALGVDPWNPVENLRGGIAYLAGLVRAYRSAALALVAYNAGPQHAERVRTGQSVPYRETRRYFDVIRASYPLGEYERGGTR